MNGNSYNSVSIAMATEFPSDNNYRQNQGTTQPKLALLQIFPSLIHQSLFSWEELAAPSLLCAAPAVSCPMPGWLCLFTGMKKNKLCCNKSCLHKFYLHAAKPFKISGKDLILKKKLRV